MNHLQSSQALPSLPLEKRRADFPLLSQRVRGKKLVYLDSAATSLKPWPVIERLSHFYSYETANVHRGAHYLADQATTFFEQTREKVREFIAAPSINEIIFTKGTTESINLVAQTYGRKFLLPGDEILISEMEHHSNIVPWQLLAEEKNLKIKVISVLENGELDLDDLEKKLSFSTSVSSTAASSSFSTGTPEKSRVRLLALTHCSNVLGTINPLKKIIEKAHAMGAKVLVDGAQMVMNGPINVVDLDADFYAFSAHKVFGPYGLGVLYGKSELLEAMPPYQGGGSMIDQVSFEKTTYHNLPHKFEAGTPNISSVIAFGAALDYLKQLSWSGIKEQESLLLNHLTAELKTIPGIKIYGEAKEKAPLVSFLINKIHPADVGQILDQENVAVRVGHHCTQPLMKRFGITGTVRASLSIYNNYSDIQNLIAALNKAKELLS